MKVVFFDFDGTIYSHRTCLIPLSTIESLKMLKANNILRVLCTGRPLKELNEFKFDRDLFDDYILMDGQIILDQNMNLIYDSPIVYEELNLIINEFNKKKVPIQINTLDSTYINYADDVVRKVQTDINTEVPKVKKYDGKKIYGVTLFIDKDKEDELKDLLSKFHVSRWNKSGIDLVPKDSGKAKGIKEYLKVKDINLNDTYSFGDGENDIDMSKLVKVSVALGNAIDELKNICDIVSADIDEDGVYLALKDLKLI